MTNSTMGLVRTELLNVADVVAREKGIQKEEVIEAMEMAIQKASVPVTAWSVIFARISIAKAVRLLCTPAAKWWKKWSTK